MSKSIDIKDMDLNTFMVIDIRTQDEYKSVHIDGVPNIEDINEIAQIASKSDKEVLLHCRAGARAKSMADELKRRGVSVCYFGGGFGYFYDKFKIVGSDVDSLKGFK